VRGTNYDTDAPAIYLRHERFKDAVRSRGWTTVREMAGGIGVSGASISRLLHADPSRRQSPGEAFIAAVLVAFPEFGFYDFFEDPASSRRAS
jgi:transcriptional regulator with XRE-family HTH domain